MAAAQEMCMCVCVHVHVCACVCVGGEWTSETKESEKNQFLLGGTMSKGLVWDGAISQRYSAGL